MLCKNCNCKVPNEAKFCPKCGAKIENTSFAKACTFCGTVVAEDNKFCPKCGKSFISIYQVQNQAISNSTSKSGKTIWFSVISAILCFIIRIALQQDYYSWSDLFNNKHVVGLDSNIKPFLTAIPIISLIIVILMIVNDKLSDNRKKTNAIIINLIFIVLALLFIWFDIPYSIIDF